MSKAFTRESDTAEGDDTAVAASRLRLPTGTKTYLTKEGANRLGQSLNDLRDQRREMMSKGDGQNLNSSLTLTRLETEIQRLQSILHSALIAEPPADEGKVGFGAWVEVRDENGEDETYQIVGIDEADAGQGRISAASPLAQILLTRQAGEIVRFQSPAGPRQLIILSVHY